MSIKINNQIVINNSGDLSITRLQVAGAGYFGVSSPSAFGTVSGYTSGGRPTPAFIGTNVIDKFPFSTDANAASVGVLSQARRPIAGQSSFVSGYSTGGYVPPVQTTIDKFPFATDANATFVGNLTQTKTRIAGQSSSISGYASGGQIGSSVNVIEKFSFATSNNATAVGALTLARDGAAGQQS